MNLSYPRSQLPHKPLDSIQKAICQAHYGAHDWGSIFASISKACLGEALAIWVVIVVEIRLVTGKLWLPSGCIRLFESDCSFCATVAMGGFCQSQYPCCYLYPFSREHTNTHNHVNVLLPKVINPSCLVFVYAEGTAVVNFAGYSKWRFP